MAQEDTQAADHCDEGGIYPLTELRAFDLVLVPPVRLCDQLTRRPSMAAIISTGVAQWILVCSNLEKYGYAIFR